MWVSGKKNLPRARWSWGQGKQKSGMNFTSNLVSVRRTLEPEVMS